MEQHVNRIRFELSSTFDPMVGIYGRLDRLKANSSMLTTSFDLELIAVFGLIYLDSFAG